MRDRFAQGKKGSYSNAIERRMQSKNSGAPAAKGKNNNFQKGPGKWTPDMWDQAGKTGKRPSHSFKSSVESRGGFGKQGRTLFGDGGGSGKARAAVDFMPGVKKSNNRKALRNQAVERRLNKGK